MLNYLGVVERVGVVGGAADAMLVQERVEGGRHSARTRSVVQTAFTEVKR